MTYWFVKWLVITYFIGVLVDDLIKPIVMYLEIFNAEIIPHDRATWARSWILIF